MTIPVQHNFTIYGGATFELVLTWKDDGGDVIPLAGYTAALQVRRKPEDTVVIDLTSDVDGGIELADAAPNIIVTIPAEDTVDFDFQKLVYDLLLTDGDGVATRLLYGSVVLSPAITVTPP